MNVLNFRTILNGRITFALNKVYLVEYLFLGII